jgi:hypothetical protein
MSGSLKLGLYILGAVIIGFFAIKLIGFLFAKFLWILILGSIVLIIGGLISQKALGGGRRTLP